MSSAIPKTSLVRNFFIFIIKCHVPDRVRFKLKQKFAKRYFIYQAMDESGHVWKPYIKLGTINAEEYKKRVSSQLTY